MEERLHSRNCARPEGGNRLASVFENVERRIGRRPAKSATFTRCRGAPMSFVQPTTITLPAQPISDDVLREKYAKGD
ncbi:MAG: hypothetical protein ACJ8G7_15790, partial [Rhizobacter sp.]